MAARVVDHGRGMFSKGFAGIDATRAVFPTVALSRDGEVCTVDASLAEQFFPRKPGQYFYEPLVLCSIFSSRHVAPGDFLGALDDEEFVVEGSGGWRGRRESDSQVTRHQLVSVTHCIVGVFV